MLKKYWPYILLAFLVILFWYPVTINNDFFYDDWDFIRTFQEGRADLGYFFTPHNEHFMPVFKFIFKAMYKVFGLNFVPYVWLLILTHIINVCLFFYLCKLIFSHAKWLPLILAGLFLSNSAYFEVLHWFTLLGIASSLLFLQLSLIYLHLYLERKEKKYLWISAVSSFFIPMNFSLGLVGIAFVALYWLAVLKRRSLELKPAVLYLVSWLLFLLLWAVFVYPTAIAAKAGIAANYSNVLPNILSGFAGFLIKSWGISILMQPVNIWAAGFLIFNFLILIFFLPLYFILNPKSERKPVLHDGGTALFAFLGALISYGAIAAARTDLPSSVFLDWGRYQLFSVFFLTIFIGNMLPSLIDIFSSIFNKQRFKYYLLFIFIIYLIGQFVIIRAKCDSPVKTEGLFVPQSYHRV